MLSLSMIVRDEQQNLDACLRSVADFVDEMVVVDTGSSDDTVAVAERWGALVHHLAWPGDFAPARNHALARTQGDWVLVLDADERLLPEAREPLRQLMAAPDSLLITLLRREEGARQSPYSAVSRLFRRHPALRWSRPYHAMVDDSVTDLQAREPHWRIHHCPVPALAHGGYQPERLAGGDKARRLRAAMEADLAERPGDPYICAKLGGLEVSEGNRPRGIALLEEGLHHCPQEAHPERFELLLHLAIARAEDDPATAIDLYRQSLALPLDPRLTMAAALNLAALLLRSGDPEGAAAAATAATTAGPELALGWYNLGLIERQRGRLEAAIAAYRRAALLDPDHAETHQNLAVALLLGGDLPGARSGFRAAIRLLEQQGRAGEASDLARRVGELVRLEAAG
ncbi:glycosyltransferase [Cyanobium sp. FGCU-6]|jgi:tetratricopeptide (TPR) repeat protein|nr:glycosyltransferase [Cyanobium sp. FGCU6]